MAVESNANHRVSGNESCVFLEENSLSFCVRQTIDLGSATESSPSRDVRYDNFPLFLLFVAIKFRGFSFRASSVPMKISTSIR